MAAESPSGKLRILSISTVFPNVREASLGVFVESRLQHMAEDPAVSIKVTAPVPLLDYSHWRSLGTRGDSIPSQQMRGRLEVFYPRWFYPPKGGAHNASFLYWRLRPFLRQLRRRFEFNVIDAHFGYPEGIAAYYLSRAFACSYTITLRGNEPMHAEHRARRRLLTVAFQNAGRVIAVSEHLRRFAVSYGVPEDRTCTIPNGIDGQVFYSRDRSAMRRKHGIAENTPVVISVGSLIERKGHHRIVRALSALHARGIAAQLLIAGGQGREGDSSAIIREEIARAGLSESVRVLGQLPQETVAELMSAADVFCLASTREGWPNVLNEALACGTPAVTTDVGAARDMISSANLGFVTPIDDQQALEDALYQSFHTCWDRQAIAARGSSRDWREVAREAIEAISEAKYAREKQASQVRRN